MSSLRISSHFIPDPTDDQIQPLFIANDDLDPASITTDNNFALDDDDDEEDLTPHNQPILPPSSSSSSSSAITSPTPSSLPLTQQSHPGEISPSYRIPSEFSPPSFGFPVEEHQQAEHPRFLQSLAQFRLHSNSLWQRYFDGHRDDVQRYAQGHSLLRDAQLLPLIHRGFPQSHRARAWLTLSGAATCAQENPGLFADCLAKARLHSPSAAQIDLDLARTFPGHPYFEREEGRLALRAVLLAYAQFDPIIGYCQGMNFLAGVTLLVFAGEDLSSAFWTFVMLMAIGRQHFSTSMIGNKAAMKTIETLLPRYVPEIAALFASAGSSTPMVPLISMSWWLSFFSTSLHIELVLMIWDNFWVHHNTIPLYAASLTIFDLYQHQFNINNQNNHQNHHNNNEEDDEDHGIDMGKILSRFREPIWDNFLFCNVDQFHTLFAKYLELLAPQQLLASESPVDREFEEIYRRCYEEIQVETEKMAVNRDLMLLSNRTHFSRTDLELLRAQFEALSTTVDRQDGCQEPGITLELFTEVVTRVMPHWISNQIPIADVFARLDQSGDGVVSFRELMMGLSIIYDGTPEEKLRLIFMLFDADKTGAIEEKELFALVSMAYRTLYSTEADPAAVAALFQALDSNRDGTIEFEEFSHIVKILPGLLEIFSLRPQAPPPKKHKWYARFWKRHRESVLLQDNSDMLRDLFKVKEVKKATKTPPLRKRTTNTHSDPSLFTPKIKHQSLSSPLNSTSTTITTTTTTTSNAQPSESDESKPLLPSSTNPPSKNRSVDQAKNSCCHPCQLL